MKSKLLVLFLAFFFIVSCGGDSNLAETEDNDDENIEDTDDDDLISDTEGDVESSVMGATIPTDVVISSPTAELSEVAASIIAKNVDITKADTEFTVASDYITKKLSFLSLASGENDCVFEWTESDLTEPSCYGPAINYQDHPDSVDGQEDGGMPQHDLGLWNEDEGSMACAAAQTNYLVNVVASKLDNMMFLQGAIACAGNKAILELPEVGASKDLLTEMSDYMDVTGVNITSATLERLADSETYPVYQTTVNSSTDTSTSEYNLKHIKTSEDNSTYKGKLSYKISYPDGDCESEMVDDTSLTVAGTVLYEKKSEELVILEMNYANFCGSSTDPFDENNDIDPADRVSDTNQDGWAHDWNYALFNLNPSNGEGSVIYSWQAGMESWTRVFNISTDVADDGSAIGDAYYGWGPDSADEERGTIYGMICNWVGPGGFLGSQDYNDVQEIAQWQGLTRAVDETVFGASDSKIKYAPTVSCSCEEGFMYSSSEDMTNDNPNGEAVINELLDLDAAVFAEPLRPADL